MSALALQALKTEKIKVLTVNPAQTSTPMTWSRPDAEYLPDKMIQPDEIAEAILMTFKMNPNVFIEVRLLLCIIVLASSLKEIEFGYITVRMQEDPSYLLPGACCPATPLLPLLLLLLPPYRFPSLLQELTLETAEKPKQEK